MLLTQKINYDSATLLKLLARDLITEEEYRKSIQNINRNK